MFDSKKCDLSASFSDMILIFQVLLPNGLSIHKGCSLAERENHGAQILVSRISYLELHEKEIKRESCKVFHVNENQATSLFR